MSRISKTAWRFATIAILSIVLVVAFVTTTPKPGMLTFLGACLGCVSGWLGARAVRKGASSMAIRAITWACGIGLLVLAMAIAEDMLVGAWASSFAACILAATLVMAGLLRKQSLVAAGNRS